MTEIADDYPEDALDWDEETDEEINAWYAEQSQAAAEAYASLPWWRRLVFDWRERRARRRLLRNLIAATEDLSTRTNPKGH